MSLLGIIILIFLVYLLVGFYLTTRLIYPQRPAHVETYKSEIESGCLDRETWEALPRQEVWIDSPYGYKIYGQYIPSPGSHQTVVIAHGITSNLVRSAKYVPLFYGRGYNVLIYDERFHGKTGGKNCTYGYYEKYDLRAVVDWAFFQSGGGYVGLHGESMGAAIVLQEAAIDDRLSFVIADCPYSDLKRLLSTRLAYDYHLPPALFLPITDFLTTLLTGMSFDTVSPQRDIPAIVTPILFIHGQEDRYIPPEMSREMYYAKTNGVRELYLAPGAGHAESFQRNPADYSQAVSRFLERLGMD